MRATLRHVDSAYTEWRTRLRAGMKLAGGPRSLAAHERARVFRIHELNVVPGILQTGSYMRAVLSFWREFFDAPDDPGDAIAFKQHRARVTDLN
ncbi:hypothetical protein GCM10010123_41110 [Pilimelia anulata]|uniref:DUF5753 domain-containing protein n=1 Tax=Pilimelia anulata TaxID=53371 RepID=A0A8J3BFL2_9ACTN|nr:Scr1 family TA system antitoxin-like transcriptional regulator [Pilimelia anulata]GGK07080.1 hypothetical protein GCM10010123_41110 [Pilimelia anulata]